MTLWGYSLLKDTPFFPTWLGGTGSIDNCFINYPFAPQTQGLLSYSLVQMGYYFEDTIDHNFIRARSNDYWEMNLHHLLTICLFGGMIAMNDISLGAFVCFIHSTTDIFTATSRILSHTIYKTATYISFIICIGVWIFTRNFIIPVACAACWRGMIYPKELQKFQVANTILVSFLTVLCFLHVYWTFLFIKMIVKAVKTGNNDDAQSKVVVKSKAK
jgi:hypothetical protein